MKKLINTFLKPFHAEIHGVGYLRKLHHNVNAPDAWSTQERILHKDVNVIFDIGSNKGKVTRLYRGKYPKAAIHAFEPYSPFHEVFWQNNPDKENIHLTGMALADKEGEADFYINRSKDTNSLLEPISIGANSDRSCKNIGSKKIQMSTLERYCQEKGIGHIDILKMDTQGAELPILKGGEALLKNRQISLIYTEAYFKPQYKDQSLLYDIANYLKEFGYFLEGIYDPYYNDKLMLWCDAIFVPAD